ncbi:hypothetical protein [Chamaesiphon sp. OTE_75_metabat_556]|uniref:hypothetical protein n=1 Tax=Chamaesiphon sp. OTE_75_metabat_556 TaxID=2964692 RepID=UPI00286CC3D8|nr:hypothetical protein [Chamaesiphon sp. OTE_75_metabat_556]
MPRSLIVIGSIVNEDGDPAGSSSIVAISGLQFSIQYRMYRTIGTALPLIWGKWGKM